MAYISKDQSKKIRETLKNEFSTKDGWQFSVTIAHYSSLYVRILKAPINFGVEKYQTVNQYHIESHFEGEAAAALTRIVEISNDGNYNNSDPMTDYFDFGWCFSLSIGDYDRPFQFVEKNGYQYKPVQSQPTTSDEGEFYGESVESFKYWFDKGLIEKELNDEPLFSKSNSCLENDYMMIHISSNDLHLIDKKSNVNILLNEKTTPANKVFDIQPLNEFYFELFCLFNESMTLTDVLDILKIYNYTNEA